MAWREGARAVTAISWRLRPSEIFNVPLPATESTSNRVDANQRLGRRLVREHGMSARRSREAALPESLMPLELFLVDLAQGSLTSADATKTVTSTHICISDGRRAQWLQGTLNLLRRLVGRASRRAPVSVHLPQRRVFQDFRNAPFARVRASGRLAMNFRAVFASLFLTSAISAPALAQQAQQPGAPPAFELDRMSCSSCGVDRRCAVGENGQTTSRSRSRRSGSRR